MFFWTDSKCELKWIEANHKLLKLLWPIELVKFKRVFDFKTGEGYQVGQRNLIKLQTNCSERLGRWSEFLITIRIFMAGRRRDIRKNILRKRNSSQNGRLISVTWPVSRPIFLLFLIYHCLLIFVVQNSETTLMLIYFS